MKKTLGILLSLSLLLTQYNFAAEATDTKAKKETRATETTNTVREVLKDIVRVAAGAGCLYGSYKMGQSAYSNWAKLINLKDNVKYRPAILAKAAASVTKDWAINAGRAVKHYGQSYSPDCGAICANLRQNVVLAAEYGKAYVAHHATKDFVKAPRQFRAVNPFNQPRPAFQPMFVRKPYNGNLELTRESRRNFVQSETPKLQREAGVIALKSTGLTAGSALSAYLGLHLIKQGLRIDSLKELLFAK